MQPLTSPPHQDPVAGEIYIVEGEAPPGARFEDSQDGQRLLTLHRRAQALLGARTAHAEQQRLLEAALAAYYQGEAERLVDSAATADDPLAWSLQFIPGFEDGPAPTITDPALVERLAQASQRQAELGEEEARVQQERSELQSRLVPHATRPLSVGRLLRYVQTQHSSAVPPRLQQVPGAVIFRYPFRRSQAQLTEGGLALRRPVVARWLVHAEPGGLWLVRQRRRVLSAAGLRRVLAQDEQLREELRQLRQQLDLPTAPAVTSDEYVASPADAGRWLARVEGPLSAVALVERCDALLRAEDASASPHDEQVLPLLMRRALAQHGHPLLQLPSAAG